MPAGRRMLKRLSGQKRAIQNPLGRKRARTGIHRPETLGLVLGKVGFEAKAVI